MNTVRNRAAANPKKNAKVAPTKEYFRLRYLRFKFKDYMKTIDFYKAIGMSIDFEGEQESFPWTNFNVQKGPAPKTIESNHLKKSAGLKDEKTEETLNQGGPLGRIIAFSFDGLVGNKESNRMQLWFEEDLDVTLNLKVSF